MHKWIGSDNGSQCYRCGMALDYANESEMGGNFTEFFPGASDVAHSLAPGCFGPETNRAHHFLLEGHPASDDAWFLNCAYGDCSTDEGLGGGPGVYDPECIGADPVGMLTVD